MIDPKENEESLAAFEDFKNQHPGWTPSAWTAWQAGVEWALHKRAECPECKGKGRVLIGSTGFICHTCKGTSKQAGRAEP